MSSPGLLITRRFRFRLWTDRWLSSLVRMPKPTFFAMRHAGRRQDIAEWQNWSPAFVVREGSGIMEQPLLSSE